ncbi:MAG: DUF1553 domain-containing protein, partial [Planctomycetaceae bacterium]|nr:DUF1553 domain-containing protein [Planctomycetaceae bacterium]
ALAALLLFASIGVLPAADKPKASGSLPWSFKPLTKPQPPVVKDTAWPRDDLDRFILAKLEAAGLKPNGDADPATLARRLSFDLTGLPTGTKPTNSIAAQVDAALASPRFGERWARHWLDTVRYADSVGRNWNAPYTYAWRYRDYVIDAFNADKPYDRFITEQIAGDLLPVKSLDERRENLVATGLLALGSLDLQALDREQFYLDGVDDQIDVVTRSMLGLTVSCARCHDHKYDPVTMRDYYALAGIFYSTKILAGTPYRGQGNGYVDHESLHRLPIAARGKPVSPDVIPGVHSMSDYQAIWSTGKRDIRFTTDPNLAMGVSDDEISDCALRVKGDPHDRGPAPPRGDVKIAGLPPITKPGPNASGRLELARWIASPRHPLTARVIVNRVWQHLIGQPLVATPDDFGATSEPPSHPELLDHLASRFIADGWSIKKLVRTIVLSRTYQLSGATRGQPAHEADPQNTLCWRANLRRLEFEPLRDSLLVAAGELTFDRPEGIQIAGIGGKSAKSQVHSLLDIDAPYRTIYLPVIRGRLPETFNTFDFPDPCQIAGRRDVTTVAPQALFFLNSRLVTDCAEATAARVLKSSSTTDAARLTWLYQTLFARAPTADEVTAAAGLFKDLQRHGADAESCWTTLVQGLLASAEFRYIR